MMSTKNLTEQINDLLPQTQCEACGFKGCKPYAQAMATGKADIDLCAPGGKKTLTELANLLQRDPTPYINQVTANYRPPSVAIIEEDLCIGCMKCINVCPVDAIVGTAKMMHTIIADECSGCELCIPACPMDCIQLQLLAERSATEQAAKTSHWRARYEQRNQRLEQQHHEKSAQHSAAKLQQAADARAAKQAEIAAAIARVKAKRADHERG